MGRKEISFAEVKEDAEALARELVENSGELANDEYLKAYSEVKGLLKKPMTISRQAAADISPEWGAWRRAQGAWRWARGAGHWARGIGH